MIPATNKKGAAHTGEDGRYVEGILKDTLQKFLPAGIEILTGFILRSGVKSNFSGKSRKNDNDLHSSQLDLIIYDSEHYPVYQRFGDTAVVLPEGVIGIISVKKTLYLDEIQHELQMLHNASKLCAFADRKGPFLALVSIACQEKISPTSYSKKVFESIENIIKHTQRPICYESMAGFIGCLEKWTIHKIHHESAKEAEFQMYLHEKEEEYVGVQFLIDGILNVYYASNASKKPGYVAYPKRKPYAENALKIAYDKERSERFSLC